MLGIIGGLGPLATAYFLELIATVVKASSDQEHPEFLLYNNPTVPDRTDFILGKSESDPLPDIVSAGKALCSLGADVLAIPCITAHYFHSEIESGVGVPVIHGIKDVAEVLIRMKIGRVGIMATDGTINSGLFQNELEGRGIEVICPCESHQNKVMSLIYNDIKSGHRPDMGDFECVYNSLKKCGAEVIILGCTELSLIKRFYSVPDDCIDVMEVLAVSAVRACGKDVRDEYKAFCISQNGD